MTATRAVMVATLLSMPTAPAMAQGYRVRFDTQFQSVAYRGWSEDSILASDVVTGPNGRSLTPDGVAVRCRAGFAYCTYFRPGPALRGQPLTATADFSVWGLGVRGLSLRGTARLATDVGDDVWPGTTPSAQLMEGYAEYAHPVFTVQVGRTHELTRFGFMGFDGGRGELRLLNRKLRTIVYGGWGLARGVDLPVTSTALNPLDDFQPGERQLLVGASVGWTSALVQGRILYQREVDPRVDQFVSERGGAEIVLRTPIRLDLTAGADYDIAQGFLGSAEARLDYALPRGWGALSGGVRQYRPHFPLWTIWGAFSPVPYQAVFGSVAVVPIRGIELLARGEGYRYSDVEAVTPLVETEDRGWRYSFRGTYARSALWSVYYAFHSEFGAGASSIGYEGGGRIAPGRAVSASVMASYMERPLEFRLDDSKLLTVGAAATYAPFPQWRLSAGLRWYDETRRRPDAAQFAWNQFRFNIGASFYLASATRGSRLPPAILRIPMAPGNAR